MAYHKPPPGGGPEDWPARLRWAIESDPRTQRELAEIAGLSDYSRLWVWFSGKESPQLSSLLPVLVALDVSLDWLFLGKGSPEIDADAVEKLRKIREIL